MNQYLEHVRRVFDLPEDSSVYGQPISQNIIEEDSEICRKMSGDLKENFQAIIDAEFPGENLKVEISECKNHF